MDIFNIFDLVDICAHASDVDLAAADRREFAALARCLSLRLSYIKGNVCKGRSQSVDDLKTTITKIIGSITAAEYVIFKICVEFKCL